MQQRASRWSCSVQLVNHHCTRCCCGWHRSSGAVPPSGLECGRLADNKKTLGSPTRRRSSLVTSCRHHATPTASDSRDQLHGVLPACLVASRAHAVDSRQGTGTGVPACQKRMQQDLTTERAVFQQCSCGLVVSGQVCGQRLWPALARYATPLNPSCSSRSGLNQCTPHLPTH